MSEFCGLKTCDLFHVVRTDLKDYRATIMQIDGLKHNFIYIKYRVMVLRYLHLVLLKVEFSEEVFKRFKNCHFCCLFTHTYYKYQR